MATRTAYVPRLHQDDLDRIGSCALTRRSRFVESDLELARIDKACDKAHLAYVAARNAGDGDAARKRWFAVLNRHQARIDALEADWDKSGHMSRAYQSALLSYECSDPVIGYRADDARVYDDRPLVTVLCASRADAQYLAAELLGVGPWDVTLHPVFASRRNRERRSRAA